MDYIIENLPVRFSDQDKDSGKYSQAEQVAWEVMGLLEKLLIFTVDKYDCFVAVKILLENLMTSGLKLDHPHYPVNQDPVKNLKAIARKLHNGLVRKLSTVYGMKKIKTALGAKNCGRVKDRDKK